MPSLNELSPSADAHPPSRVEHNFLVLVAYQIILRVGWIFKTESIVMPAVLDSIAGAGWIRGWLPLLNRVGHSLPPLLSARRIKSLPRKKWALLIATGFMSLLFLALSFLFYGFSRDARWWVPVVFLVIYAVFFMCVGLTQLAFSTLQGKLVPTTRRGRLMLVSNTLGSVIAIAAAIFLLPRWLQTGHPRFDLVFCLSGALFGLSALSVALLSEDADAMSETNWSVAHHLWDAYEVFTQDALFRRLALVGALFSASIMLFPHYQNLGLGTMRMELKSLMWWVVIQNLGTGVFSIPAGAIADRCGNRLVLQVTLLGIAAAPTLAIVLLHVGAAGHVFYHLVFVLVGLTPVVFRTFQNFTLEICSTEDHPRYLSTLGLCMAAPLFLSPLIGLMVDWTGFEVVFLSLAGLVLFGWLITFHLDEPRHHVTEEFFQTDD
jgi:MFS family permease